tara:strand:- start:32407 stop:35556 length:3150 start_codon:yes stop_codon:yes gene_type:complete
MTKTIKVPFKKLKWIHHISDIQVRNLKRHKEYEEVFERTYEEIKKNKDNAVAYIAGDIAHSKTEMSPELVDQLSRLFKNLSDIVPTIIIAGNHDCNLNNRSRLDVLTPIVNNLNHPNLHYFKDSGIYKCADTSFVVWDCWDKEDNFITSDQVDGDTKIVLFHGTVDRCETDLGFRLPSDVKITKFDGYDMGLLGDIHKRQHLNKEETISYCGSLVQQNHGEGLSHGYLLWDVPKRKSEYIEIPNDYGYYTLDIEKGQVPDVDDMPKKARLRVRVANTTGTQLKKALSVIRKKYNIKEVVVTRTDRITDKVRTDKIDIGDITDTSYQYSLIEDYLKRNHLPSDETLVKIKKLNEEINGIIQGEDVTRNINWTLKKFEWSNMFSYGEDNVIDFTKLNGIVGMFAPNASGKSSLLDALSFCLFDDTSRTGLAKNVMNNKRDKFYCKLNFEIDGLDYYIERIAKKISFGKHVKVDVNFWMVDETGEEISLNGDQRRTTDINIKKVIGTYDDFVLTSLSLQNNSTVFIDKTQKERKDLLAQFMGISIFDKLWTTANSEISEVSAVLRDFAKTDYDKELTDVQNEYESYTSTFDKLNEEKNLLTTEIEELSVLINKFHKKLKDVDTTAVNLDSLKKEKEEVKSTIDSIDIELGNKETNRQEYKIKIEELSKKVNKFSDDSVNEKYEELTEYESKRDKLKFEIDKLKIEVQNKLEKIDKLANVTYDEECNHCMSNPLTMDARKTKEQLGIDKQRASELVQKDNKFIEIIDGLKDYKDKKINYDLCIESLKKIEIQNNKIDTDIEVLKQKKETLLLRHSGVEEKISLYYKQKREIEYNKEIEKEIDDAQNELSNENYQLDVLEKKIKTCIGQMKVLETKKENILSQIEKVKELEDKHEAYNFYLDAVKRDGVPYELIQKAIPTIEGEINDILSQIVDFSMVLDVTDGKNINCHIAYDDDRVWPLELSSGMERFISSLAMRVALINVSNLPRGNFLAIDEGWGTMDSDNLNSVYSLFQYLKSQFQFTFIVSHIEQMRDAVDSLLEIKKESGFSSVNLT